MLGDVLASVPQLDQGWAGLRPQPWGTSPSPGWWVGVAGEFSFHSSDRVTCVHFGTTAGLLSQDASAPPAPFLSSAWSSGPPRSPAGVAQHRPW